MSGQTGAERGPVRPDDLDITLAVLRALGPDNEQAAIAEFLDRLTSAINDRVDAHIEARLSTLPPPSPGRPPSIALGIVSVVVGFLIAPIALGVSPGSVSGIIAFIVSWAAIATVNVANARRK